MKNILFITATRLGDAVLSTGVLAALLEKHPNASVTVVCGTVPAPLFRAVPRLRQCIALRKKPYAMHWVDMWRQVAGTWWDLVVDLRRSAASCLLMTPRHRSIPADRAGEHKLEQYARTLNLSPPPAPRIWLDDAARASAAAYLPPGRRYIGIGPTANWAGKIWPADRFLQVMQTLMQPGEIFAGCTPVIFGAVGEEAQAAPLFQSLGNTAVDLVGKLDVLASAAALAQCECFIGNDSGLMHMAGAVGIRTLGLFGPSHPEVYAPRGPHAAYVRTEKSYAELTGAADYDHRTTDTLMESLPVDTVLTALRNLMAKGAA